MMQLPAPGRQLSLGSFEPGPPWDPVLLGSTSGAEGERRGCTSASQNRKPSCLRAHVIGFHIMGPCSYCQKRPPAPRGPGHQVPLLNRPLWRTQGLEVPGALSRRALWGRGLSLAASARGDTSLVPCHFLRLVQYRRKSLRPDARPPLRLVIKLLPSSLPEGKALGLSKPQLPLCNGGWARGLMGSAWCSGARQDECS